MATQIKEQWRMGVRDKKNWDKWQWGKEYDSFEELMKACMPWLKANPGRVTKIIVRNAYIPISSEGAQ